MDNDFTFQGRYLPNCDDVSLLRRAHAQQERIEQDKVKLWLAQRVNPMAYTLATAYAQACVDAVKAQRGDVDHGPLYFRTLAAAARLWAEKQDVLDELDEFRAIERAQGTAA